jgi:hypothetical protein
MFAVSAPPRPLTSAERELAAFERTPAIEALLAP